MEHSFGDLQYWKHPKLGGNVSAFTRMAMVATGE
jgi:hypothetical protein